MPTLAEAFAHALQLQQVGRLPQAMEVYRQILKVAPNHGGAVHYLGLAMHQSGQSDAAIPHLAQSTTLAPDNASFHHNLGAVYRSLGRLDEAAASLQRALELQPDYAEAELKLGNVHMDRYQLDEAEACFRRALELDPRFAEAANNLGNVQKERGQLEEAGASYQQALQINPNYFDARSNLGTIYIYTAQLDEAVKQCQKVLATEPNHIGALVNLGNAYRALGRVDESREMFQCALTVHPAHPLSTAMLAVLETETGHFDEAVTLCRQVLADDPEHAMAYATLVAAQSESIEDGDVARLEAIVEKPQTAREAKVDASFALGKIYDRQKKYDQAFAHYQRANRLNFARFDPQAHLDYVTALIDTYSAEFFTRQGTSGIDSKLPVFIVGMPRSGTTLVEQILASLSEVHGAGELQDIPRLADSIPERTGSKVPYPAAADSLDASILHKAASAHLESLARRAGAAARCTDKLPANFLHLGLIALLFPGAQVIHCRRDPLDVCLSCFFQRFEYVSYSSDLEHLGHYYRDYERLMEHWREVLPLTIFELEYEELLENQEEVSRCLVAHCGLEWDARCIEFYRHDRPIQTTSSWQARQPLYKTSRQRWKNYEKFLGPLRAVLES